MSDQEEQQPPLTEESSEGEFASAQIPKQVTITDEELKKIQHEAMDYKDKYLRQLAESENARKRLQKEKTELSRYAVESIIVDFIKPIDNLENALSFASAMSDEVKNWAIGFQMILGQFKDVLAQNNVVAMEAKGVHFDPHLHEAVEMIETDEEQPGVVVEVCMKGYKMGDKIIRHARVKVAKEKNSNEEN